MEFQRKQIRVFGIVQGVGFRPFVWRLARSLDCTGSVCNDSMGVTIEVQASRQILEEFVLRLKKEVPPAALIQRLVVSSCPLKHDETTFAIEASRVSDCSVATVAPDLAPCPDCLAEMSDSDDRRFGYPFVNCTHCGPRFTIIRSLPYDRERTTMGQFALCEECRAEYESPIDRRFHAEPNACPACGPRIWFVDGRQGEGMQHRPYMPQVDLGRERARTEEVIAEVRRRIEAGHILALKGIGGFHLTCDATQVDVVQELRVRKHRPDKPLAVMVADVASCRKFAAIGEMEATLLESKQRPIVLVPKKGTWDWLEAVSPGNPTIGVMLPYAPLHHLLLPRDQVWVMTSGNLSEEPIAIDNQDAMHRLSGIADGFLLHDRPIQVPCDDSVVVHSGRSILPIRRSRGYAPLPIELGDEIASNEPTVARSLPPVVLAVGGELKSTVCLAIASKAFMSQHIGDLSSIESLAMLESMSEQMCRLYQSSPEIIASDQHPGYLSVQWAARFAEKNSIPHVRVQHHHAHAVALMSEHNLPFDQPILCCVFDGTGYGTDKTIWGGEWLLVNAVDSIRYAHLKTFPLPGGDACILHPARAALALLFRYGMPWHESLPCVRSLTVVQRVCFSSNWRAKCTR